MQQHIDPAPFKPHAAPVKRPFWQKWQYILGSFVVIALLVTSIIRIFTPPPAGVPLSNFAQTSTNTQAKPVIKGLELNGSFTPAKATYTIYSAQQVNTTETLLPVLTDKYQLQPTEGSRAWNGPEFSLTFDRGQNRYSLFRNGELTSRQHIEQARSLEIASAFLNDLGITNVLPILTGIQYYENPIEMDLTNEFKAEIITIPYAPMIENVPLLFNNSAAYPFQVMINSDYQVQKVTFQPYTYTASPSREVSLISVADAVENIEAGKGAIISTTLVELQSPTIDQITSGTLTDISLEYRLDPDLQLLYPFYRFKGKLLNQRNQEFDANLFTPAVKTE